MAIDGQLLALHNGPEDGFGERLALALGRS
jgi:hypothetical protein